MPRTKQANKPEVKPFSNFGVGFQRAQSERNRNENLADAPKIALPALVLAAGRYVTPPVRA